jgi:hypothetical protein
MDERRAISLFLIFLIVRIEMLDIAFQVVNS